MGFIEKIGKAKAKITAWSEEKEQKEYERMKTEAKLAKEYNKRDAEKQKMQKEISKAKQAKFKNSFLGKVMDGFDEMQKPSKSSKAKKGKKIKLKREEFDMFSDQDPWG